MEGFRRDQWGLSGQVPVLIRRNNWGRALGNCDGAGGDLFEHLERRRSLVCEAIGHPDSGHC
jgi:hypothetical protein